MEGLHSLNLMVGTFPEIGRRYKVSSECTDKVRKRRGLFARAWKRMLHGITHEERKYEQMRDTLMKAVQASQSHAENATVLWEAALENTSGASRRRAFSAPFPGHKSIIEAALSTRDWKLLSRLGRRLPAGLYAEGRVAVAAGEGWFGACKDGWAHGVVVGLRSSETWSFAGECYEGRPHGPCSYRSWGSPELLVHCERGVHVGTATYWACKAGEGRKFSDTVQLPGDWWSKKDIKGRPAVECLWTLSEGSKKMRELRGRVGDATPNERYTIRFQEFQGTLSFRDGGVFTGRIELNYYGSAEAVGTWVGPRQMARRDGGVAPGDEPPIERITGRWHGGMLQSGRGQCSWRGGSLYDGELGYAREPNGEGTLTWRNGASYAGQWERGCPQGDGVLTWPDGKRLAGYFYGHVGKSSPSVRTPYDVAIGDGRGVRFCLNAQGEPDARTVILLGASPAA